MNPRNMLGVHNVRRGDGMIFVCPECDRLSETRKILEELRAEWISENCSKHPAQRVNLIEQWLEKNKTK